MSKIRNQIESASKQTEMKTKDKMGRPGCHREKLENVERREEIMNKRVDEGTLRDGNHERHYKLNGSEEPHRTGPVLSGALRARAHPHVFI